MKNLRSGIKVITLATLIGTICAPKLVLSADAPGRAAMNTIIEGEKKKVRFPGEVIWMTLKWGI